MVQTDHLTPLTLQTFHGASGSQFLEDFPCKVLVLTHSHFTGGCRNGSDFLRQQVSMKLQKLLALAALLCVCVAPARAGVMPVFIVAGQSNATGYATNSAVLSAPWQAAQPNVLYSGEGGTAVNWVPLHAPTQTQTTLYWGSGFGPELTLGQTISSLTGNKPVGIVKYAVNGSDLVHDWNPQYFTDPYYHPGANNYNYLKSRVTDSLTNLPFQQGGATGKVAAFFWMQGESDALQGRTTAQYEADLTNFIATVRTDYGANLPFIFGLINNADSVFNQPGVTFSGPNTAAIRQAQKDIASASSNPAFSLGHLIPNTYLVDTDAFARDNASDLLHFNNQGIMDLGTAFAQQYVNTIPEPATLSLLPLMAMLLVRRKTVMR